MVAVILLLQASDRAVSVDHPGIFFGGSLTGYNGLISWLSQTHRPFMTRGRNNFESVLSMLPGSASVFQFLWENPVQNL